MHSPHTGPFRSRIFPLDHLHLTRFPLALRVPQWSDHAFAIRAARSLRRYWKISCDFRLSLSIAIALGVLALSVSYTALLLPPAAPAADRLVTIYERSPGEAIGQISYPDYQYLREHNHVFTDIAAAPNSVGLNENMRRQWSHLEGGRRGQSPRTISR